MIETDYTPAETAALFVTWLQRHGAVLTLNEQGYIRCNLDGATCVRDEDHAGVISGAVFALRDEIRAILRAERVRH